MEALFMTCGFITLASIYIGAGLSATIDLLKGNAKSAVKNSLLILGVTCILFL